MRDISMQKSASRILVIYCAIIVLATFAAAFSQAPVATRPPGERVLVKPDLFIARFSAEREGLTADGAHRVRLSVQVRCGAVASMTCSAFKILVEWADSATGPFTRIGEAGVTSLSSGSPASRTIPTETRTFSDTVRSGATHYYRAVVDSGSQVVETNESNNTATTSYRASGCAGSDLVLTQVRLQRTREGGSLVHVWVRNRCLEACTGDIIYSIDEHEAVPGMTGVEQGIGALIPGETEVGPMGTTVAAGRIGHDATYTVSIVVRSGACRETSTTNNSCRVTIRAGTDSQTFRCN